MLNDFERLLWQLLMIEEFSVKKNAENSIMYIEWSFKQF